jgi:hypothetical protein
MNRSDNFNRADTASAIGTPSDGGSAWSVLFGTWGIVGNQGYESSGGVQTIAVLESSSSEGEVAVTISTFPAATKSAGVFARATTWGNGFYFEFLNDFGGYLRFYKMVGGTGSVIAQANTGISAGDRISLAFTAANVWTPKVNGVASSLGGSPPYVDSFNSTATKHGLWNYETTATRFEDFAFTDSAAPPPAVPAMVADRPRRQSRNKPLSRM